MIAADRVNAAMIIEFHQDTAVPHAQATERGDFSAAHGVPPVGLVSAA
jgi:hypothetical protein